MGLLNRLRPAIRKPLPPGQDGGFFLPDFCTIRMVFALVVLGEILAILLTLVQMAGPAYGMDTLGMISLFIQWITLSAAALLCSARAYLGRLSETRAATLSYLGIVAVVYLVSEAGWVLTERLAAGALAGDHPMFLLRNVGIGAIVAALALRYFYVQAQWERQIRAEGEARVQALQSRIRPHFLFNCMNTIASLTRSRPEAAEQAVMDLAGLFRASLAEGRQRSTLAEEVALCRQYLRIEGLRLGDRLRVDWAVDALPQDASLPPLSLQPLVENAVYHGVEPIHEGGTIRIAGTRHADGLHITIDNPWRPDDPARHGNRIAQDNVRQRLEACYPGRSRVEVQAGKDSYRVLVELPYEPTPANTDRG
jgi:two-component system sensor histidine kinase AlgZ